MRFEIKLPPRLNVWALRAAGVEIDGLSDLSLKVIEGKEKLPATVKGQYHLSNPRVDVLVTVLTFGPAGKLDVSRDSKGIIIVKSKPVPGAGTQMQIQIDDERIGNAIRATLQKYSLENNGEAISEQEHDALWVEIEKILKREKVSYEKLQRREGVLTRRAIEELMALAEKTEPIRRGDVYSLFTDNWVPKSERALVAPWLMRRFEHDYIWDDQLGMRIWDNSVQAIAEDLIRLIEDRRYDHHRAPLCTALAKTKHPRAAEVIASVMHERWMGFFCMQALSKLADAGNHVEKIKKLLRASDGDIRRAARKLLKKLAIDIEPAPPAVHLISSKGKIPRDLQEWSSNLDMDDLRPTLEKLSRCIDDGFGNLEILEVCAVAEEMRHNQTKALKYSISASRGKADLFIVIFMDHLDAPDLAIHSSPQVIARLEALTAMDPTSS
jgi:hypothetical protein